MILDEKVLESLSRLFGILRDTNRLKIIFVIGKEKKHVSEIMEETALPQTLVSFHLRPLRESGILLTERKGPFIYYRLSEPSLIDLLISLCGVSPKGESMDERNLRYPPMSFMMRWMKGGN
jgi:ArsR family transcriptional regulator, arsenate/arsenite/antimonite-responsive transcriptional repressor